MTKPHLTDKYGIYTTEGKKLPNSDELLNSKKRFWYPITESVLDRIPNNIYGILLHKIYVNKKIHWIVRESKKSTVCCLEEARFFVSRYLVKNQPM